MKSQEDSIALQGIKFWSHVCNEEIAIKASEVVEQGRTPENSSRFYAKGALRFLVPILTVLLIAKQEEYDDEDDCNPCKAASVCLKLLAKCCENDIVPLVLPFIHENLVNSDWKFRDAAVMTFGSMLEGPDPDYLKPHVVEIAIPVIRLLQDESVVVRDTVAWTLGRICELLPEAVLNDNSFPMLLEALVQRLDDEPRVAANICRAFISLAKSGYKTALSNINDDSEPLTYCLSTSFQIITSKLIVTTNRPDAQQANLRNAACEALMELVQNSAQDCYPVVKDVSTLVTERIKVILQMESQVQSASDRMQYNDLQSLLCAILQSVLRKMKLEDVQNISEEVMSLLLQMFSRGNMRSGGVQEDVLLVVETLVQVLGTDFIRYVDAFKEYLYAGLENVDEYQVALAVVGLVGDMCRALNTYIMPICDEIMDRLLQNLRNKEVHRSIKPQILSVFGDIAMAIGPNFTIYLNPVLETLQQASQVSQTRVDKTDFDMINYLNELRDGCLKAYTDIVQGLKAVKEDANNGALEVVFNNVPFIILFIEQIASDGNVAACAGLLRDLCSIFTGCVTEYMDRPLIQSILQEGQRSTRQN